MSLIITNGKQVTKDNQLVDVHLKIDGQKIVAVSEQLDFDIADNDQVIDVAGKLVTTGLILKNLFNTAHAIQGPQSSVNSCCTQQSFVSDALGNKAQPFRTF